MAEYRLDIVGSAEGLLTGLNNAQEALQEVSAEAVATGKATQAAFAQTGGIEKMQRSLKDQFIFLGKTEVQLNKLRTALKNTFDPKEVAALNVQLKQTGESLIKFDQETDKTVSSQKSLKAQLRENKAILAEMEEQGLETTKSFFDLQVQTGKLQDQINDTNERIKFFGSDTKGLDGLIGVTKAATAGFAVGQGAAALFGAENENVQKALLKVNAAMAILNGLQEIQQALQKSSAARITIETALQKIKIFFLGAETAATEGLTKAQIAGANAAKVLKGALISTGIIGLITLLASAAESMGLFGGSTEDTTDKIKDQTKALQENIKTYEEQIELMTQANERVAGGLNDKKRELELLQARGADAQKIFEKEQQIRREEKKGLEERLRALTIFGVATEERELQVAELKQDILDKDNEITAATISNTVRRANAAKEASEKVRKLAEAERKAAEDFLNNNLGNQENNDKKILDNELKFLNTLEQIKLLELDIEFESGDKSIENQKRIAAAKLQIQIESAQKQLELLKASNMTGVNDLEMKQIEAFIAKARNDIADLGKTEDPSDNPLIKALGLDIDPEGLNKIKEGLAIIADNIKQIFSDLLDGAISANEGVINNLDDQISKVQANIEKQEALQREGQANNLAAERENLDRLQAERLKAFEKQKQLERQKLTLDAATQVSSMITASANIFKSLSPLGPVGVALAVVAIASMFAAFANSQVQARKAINQQTLGKGGLVKGKRHDSDGWGGERYVSDSGNETYIEDGEYVVNRKQSQKYYKLIEAINNDNLKQMLNGTGVQLSEDKIEAHKQLKQGYNDAQVVRQMGLSGGDNNTEKLRKDFNDFRNEQKTKSVITYQDGKRIEIRGNRTIITRLK